MCYDGTRVLPYCSGLQGKRKVVMVVVDFLVTICPCPVFAAAAPAFFSLSLVFPRPVAAAALYAGPVDGQVCTQGIVSSEGDCQMAAAVNDFRRQFFFFKSACCFADQPYRLIIHKPFSFVQVLENGRSS